VTVTADFGASVDVLAPLGTTDDVIAIRNLSGAQRVVLRGIDVLWTYQAADVLRIEDNLGQVWIEDGCYTPGLLQPSTSGGIAPPATVSIRDSASVGLHECVVHGRDGAQGTMLPTPAGHALQADESHVAVHDSSLTGGAGYDGYLATSDLVVPGGVGGSGLVANGGTLLLSMTAAVGGRGGDGVPSPTMCIDAGDGGTGLLLSGTGPVATLVTPILIGGPGGSLTLPPCAEGVEGLDLLVTAGTVSTPSWRAGSVRSASPIREGQLLTLAHTGAPGDFVVDLFGLDSVWAPSAVDALSGVVLVGPRVVQAAGTLSSMGDLATSVLLGELGPGVVGLELFVQSIHIAPGAVPAAVTSRPTALVLLDGSL
jgi:hypothetical protein